MHLLNHFLLQILKWTMPKMLENGVSSGSDEQCFFVKQFLIFKQK